MKKIFLYALTAVFSVSCMTSCSDDDDPVDAPVVPGEKLEAKTYTATDGLVLQLNGQPVAGKMVTYTPGKDNSATIKLEGEPFDLSQILESIGTKADNASGLKVPTCGVIPGSPIVEIPVTLEGTGEECTFSGNGKTEYCSFKYSGTVRADSLGISISDVVLDNKAVCGTWKVPVYGYDDEAWDYVGNSPAVVTWFADKKIPLDPSNPEMGLPIGGLAFMMLQMGLIPDSFSEDGGVMTVNDFLQKALKSVTFREDGNIIAEYVDMKNSAHPVVKSPAGIAQYVVKEDGKILLFLNPQQIAAATLGNAAQLLRSRADDSLSGIINTEMINELMSRLLPMLQNGVPLLYHPYEKITDYEENTIEIIDSATSFVLGTDFLLPLLKTFAPMFKDEEVLKLIMAEIGKNEDFAMFAPMVEGMLKSLPDIIDSTTKIEIGINLEK